MRTPNLKSSRYLFQAALALGVCSASCQDPKGSSDASEVAASQRSLKKFIKETHIHGVPYGKASGYTAKDAKTLVGWLGKSKYKEYRSNIVLTLGMIGDRSAFEPLLSFIREGEPGQTMSRDEKRAKTAAVQALGYLVHRSRDFKARDFLMKAIDPDFWVDKGPVGKFPGVSNPEEQRKELAKHAIIACGLTGQAAPRKSLEKFHKRLRSPHPHYDVVKEAINANREIQENGMLAYTSK